MPLVVGHWYVEHKDLFYENLFFIRFSIIYKKIKLSSQSTKKKVLIRMSVLEFASFSVFKKSVEKY